MKMQRILICVPHQLVKQLKDTAQDKGISMSELIRYILDQWMNS